MKKIGTLIRLYKFELDEKRRALQALLAQLERMETARAQMDQELLDEQKTAKLGLEMGMTYHGYSKKFIQRREEMDASIAQQKVEIQKSELLVQMAFQELKKYEITAENQAKAAKYAADTKAQAALDESGMMAHERKKKS